MTPQARQRALLGAVCAGTGALIVVGRTPTMVFILLVVGTFAAYAALIKSLGRARLVSERAIVFAIAGLMLFAVAMPVRSSRDVFNYIMYGRIVSAHNASPYTHVPSEYPGDPALKLSQFPNQSSPYGPLWTGLSATGTSACGWSPLCGRLFFQTLAAIGILGATVLVKRSTGSWVAAACVGLNPILIASVVNGAHVDGLGAFFVVAAVVYARRRPLVAGALLGLAAATKFNALLPAGVLLAWMFFRQNKVRALMAGAVAALITVAGYLAIGGTRALRPLHDQALLISHHSIWFEPSRWIANHLSAGTYTRARALERAGHITATIGLVAVLVAVLMLAGGRLVRGLGPDATVASAIAAYVLISPYILPWYTAALIPLLAMRRRARSTWLLLSYAALLYLAYPSRTPAHPSFIGLLLPQIAHFGLPFVELLVLLALIVGAWRRRPAGEVPEADLDVVRA